MTARAARYSVAVEKIDADRAAELLAFNTMNRPLSQSRIVVLSRKMTAGHWMFTGQAHVIVSRDNILLNGQHTLHAVVESDTIIETVVVTGVDPDAFSKIDIGFRRTAGNILGTAGASNANTLGAVIRLVEAYDSLESTNRGGWTYRRVIDADELVETYLADGEGFNAAASFGKALSHAGRATGVSIQASTAGAFHYLAIRDGHDPLTVEAFAQRVASDVGHQMENDPSLSLRRFLINRNVAAYSGPDRGLAGLSAWIKSYMAAEEGRSMAKIYAWTRESNSYQRL